MRELGLLIAGAVIFGAAMIVGLYMSGGKATGGVNEAAVVEIVEKYVQENPGKIFETINAHLQRQQAEQEQNRVQASFENPVEDMLFDWTPVRGPENAPITIIEYSEFQCPFCKRVAPTLEQLYKKYEGQVRWAYRNNVLPFHEQAEPAAKAALAANIQGKFWEYHSALYENQQSLGEDLYVKIATDLGLDVKKFNEDRASEKVAKWLEADMEQARKVGAQGTPYVLINGIAVSGAQPLENFDAIVKRLLNQQ